MKKKTAVKYTANLDGIDSKKIENWLINLYISYKKNENKNI